MAVRRAVGALFAAAQMAQAGAISAVAEGPGPRA